MIFDFANSNLKNAQTVILGIPFDRSSSYVPGTRFGTSFARIGSCNVESYSPYFNQDLSNLKIHDAGDLSIQNLSIKKTFSQIQKAIRKYIRQSKQILIIGGEHTITIPVVKELIIHYPALRIIQLDAHSDTRDHLFGDKYSHATVIKRISEFLSPDRIYQLGLRSVIKQVEYKNQFMFSVLKHLDYVKNQIKNDPCYLTLDIDVLDCGIFPAVQTPVPNGISYQELFTSLVQLSDLNLIGCDIVEYNPITSTNLTYASIIAEIVRELILMMQQKPKK
jgi:agmatinase